MTSLTKEYELSEDDESPTYELGKTERDFLANSHGEVHRCLVRLLELQRIETLMDLLRTFSDIFRSPDVPDSDASMAEEARSQRWRRYQNAEQAEVSDPDEWATVHYGRPADSETATTTHLEEF